MTGVTVHADAFSPRIKEVHWGAGLIGIITIDYDELNAYRVDPIDPADAQTTSLNGTAGDTLTKDDFGDKQIIVLPVYGNLGSLTTANEIDNVIVTDAFTSTSGYVTKIDPITGKYDGLDAFNESVAQMSANQGRPPEQTAIGAMLTPITSSVIQPDGSIVKFTSAYVAETEWPPDFNWADTASAVWWHYGLIPARQAAIIRQSWLVNFSNNPNNNNTPYVVTADVYAKSGSINFTTNFSLSIYPISATLTLNSDGSVSSDKKAVYTKKASAPASAQGIVAQFDKTGFTFTIPQ